MTKILVMVSSLLLFLSCSVGNAPREGRVAPDFELSSLEGQKISLSQFRGKIVILDFWATWCKPCRLELPHFVALYEEFGNDALQIIGVSLDQVGSDEVASFVKEWKIPYVIVMGNGEVTKSYGGIKGIPTTFVIDKRGNVYRKYVGYRDKEVFERDIRALLDKA
ncbi:MAG: TlpA disulfide reductase family protein [Candidatus Eisenbacteria bacterium]|nr:TlpA disulfide reductase family protein [Candidatus Eisenbacteria bacterium]